MKLFLCGPIGDTDDNMANNILGTEEYVVRFQREKERLEAAGYEVFSPPHDVPNPISRRDAISKDLIGLFDCEGIAVMDGWTESTGCYTEVIVGRELGLKILTVDEWLLLI
jgi:hypothetical protein